MSVDQYLNTGIKEVIRQFPPVGDILQEYGIGCVPCTAGTCLLKDVVAIHHLAPQRETQMMTRIAAVIYPDRQVKVAPSMAEQAAGAVGATHASPVRPRRYSPPLQKLVDEHVLIKRWLALVPVLVDRLEPEWDRLQPVLVQGIGFIRNYADAYHHAKEEDILFAELDGDLDIIQTMRRDHERARALVRRLAEAVETPDVHAAKACLTEYAQLLQEHIKKEDEILYPWIDRGLSDSRVGQLFAQFQEVDRMFAEAPSRYEDFVSQTERLLASALVTAA
jgi:hemerythrin-like domain-containing protein